MTANEEELVLQAQRGDGVAFEGLIRQYDRRVLAIALNYAGNMEDAKDIYQEVFIRVYRALPSFQFRSKFSTWLHRIAVNVCLSHCSRGNHKEHVSLDGEFGQNGRPADSHEALVSQSDSERRVLDSEISKHLRKAMETLSRQQKMVFMLRHYHGYRLKEIASILHCHEGTVKKHLFEATERMRRELRSVYDQKRARYESSI